MRIAEPEIRLPSRRFEPDSVVAHLGPTNSGKTYAALEFLVESGRGVFAAPLRMLAQEAHRKLVAELGADHVGLVTGEERVNENAPIVCCTAEMAPTRGEVLVLDEIFAVGDEGFKARCEARYQELRRAGHTIVLVSHSALAVSGFCDRAILLDEGRIVMDGSPATVADGYVAMLRHEAASQS